ncbi:MAG: hypothetical protein MJZ78_07795 [Bacteroidales bacterium]|nr:hypothetical protein [Bacteroidales bacterium]
MTKKSFIVKLFCILVLLGSVKKSNAQFVSLSLGALDQLLGSVGIGYDIKMTDKFVLPIEIGFQDASESIFVEKIETYSYDYNVYECHSHYLCYLSALLEYNRFIRAKNRSSVFLYGGPSFSYNFKSLMNYNSEHVYANVSAPHLDLAEYGYFEDAVEDQRKGLGVSVCGGIGIKFFYGTFAISVEYQHVFGITYSAQYNVIGAKVKMNFLPLIKYIRGDYEDF